MIHEDLQTFNNLYSDDDATVFKALTCKKDWMFTQFLYLKGDTNICLDSRGLVHYPCIEAMLDDTLLFEDLIINENDADEDLRRNVELNLNESFAFLNLYEDIDDSAPFWIEYDFNKIDDNGFNCLFPNFFRKHPKEIWQIEQDEEKLLNNQIEQLKFAMIGHEGEHVIIMDKSNLINGAFFAPVMKKIIFKSTIDDELKIELKQIANEKEIVWEEIDL